MKKIIQNLFHELGNMGRWVSEYREDRGYLYNYITLILRGWLAFTLFIVFFSVGIFWKDLKYVGFTEVKGNLVKATKCVDGNEGRLGCIKHDYTYTDLGGISHSGSDRADQSYRTHQDDFYICYNPKDPSESVLAEKKHYPAEVLRVDIYISMLIGALLIVATSFTYGRGLLVEWLSKRNREGENE